HVHLIGSLLKEGRQFAGALFLLQNPRSGIYKDKPSLTAEPGPQVAAGGQVTLLCHTPYLYDVFSLSRDRGASLPQDCSQQDQGSFLISPVSPAHGGTYRCYGFARYSPLLWSLPSDPLELSVTGE
ncbi:leukocyte immunoglobulin-like receptor subfamily A member 2 isoform X6, partial [Leptotrombidium deliense]